MAESVYFDWRRFCDLHRVPYVTRGPNTARGHISIRCPMCSDDPSEHCGLSLDPHNPMWGCLRDAGHRGRHPARLIRALLRCSEAHAAGLVKSMAPELDAFESTAAQLLRPATTKPTPKATTTKPLYWTNEMKPVTSRGYGKHFLEYLEGRGFVPAQTIADSYDLHYTLVGPFAWRLLIPFHLDGQMVGWTGRSIQKEAQLRYFTLPADEKTARKWQVPQARYDPEQYVWNQDALTTGGSVLVICEGPLDALKLHHWRPGPEYSVVALLGMIKGRQLELLGNAGRRYQSIAVVLDREAYGSAFSLAAQLEELSGTRAYAVEPLAKDPGAMDPQQLGKLFASLS